MSSNGFCTQWIAALAAMSMCLVVSCAESIRFDAAANPPPIARAAISSDDTSSATVTPSEAIGTGSAVGIGGTADGSHPQESASISERSCCYGFEKCDICICVVSEAEIVSIHPDRRGTLLFDLLVGYDQSQFTRTDVTASEVLMRNLAVEPAQLFRFTWNRTDPKPDGLAPARLLTQPDYKGPVHAHCVLQSRRNVGRRIEEVWRLEVAADEIHPSLEPGAAIRAIYDPAEWRMVELQTSLTRLFECECCRVVVY